MVPGHKMEWYRFAEKVQMAVESSRKNEPDGGTSGLEVELNILDGAMRPVAAVGAGPERRSFADFLHEERLPEWVRDSFQLEVFNWMTELTTKPHYTAVETAAEARLLEGVLLNTLAELELTHDGVFFTLHGNIPQPVDVGSQSIPAGWNLARRRYLERCVGMYGSQLATAGVHTNHSFPEALLSWDFFHLPLADRKSGTLENYRNQAVIRATRLLRPYCPLFIAVSAASPLDWEDVDGVPLPVVTNVDSQRLHAFPNPAELDVPGLYRSHEDYLRISYDLVRRRIRFGANNWTPIRARSDVDPVRRNILATSDQLRELYNRGIYASGEHESLEQTEQELVIENLCARVDLPMNRVEVRTDEGGDDFELSVAKIVFKDLLMLRIHADPDFGADYAYGGEDIVTARHDEMVAAREGLDARISRPFGRGPASVRELLGEVLDELDPLAEGLGVRGQLEPLREMAGGGPNPAESLREWIAEQEKKPMRTPSGATVVDPEILREMVDRRRVLVAGEVGRIVGLRQVRESQSLIFGELIAGLESMSRSQPAMPVRMSTSHPRIVLETGSDRTRDVIELAAELVRIPSVTNCPDERIDEVYTCARFVAGWLRDAGLEVELYEHGRYPSMVAGFPGALVAPITLSGHFDVVPPEPDDRQFEPRVDGDYFWGRGSADMKTVVASNMAWMRDRLRAGSPFPPINTLLVGNEENGEGEPFGTPHMLADLAARFDWSPEIMLVGERTGEQGDELFGQVCPENRGVARVQFTARGKRGHTGTGEVPADLLDRLVELRGVLTEVFPRHLTLSSLDGWESAARFPFLNVGEAGVYNITAGEGSLGLEMRTIPSDDLEGIVEEMTSVCRELDIEVDVQVMEAGVACPSENPHLQRLIASVETVSGRPVELGKKKPGSSARFAPGGNAVVWGQSGIGPHSKEERHFIPSIEPYLAVLDDFAKRCP